MRKLVSTADVCASVTGPSVAAGLGLNRDVAINDADPGRRVGSTARQEKSISPDPAHNCPTAIEQSRAASVTHCQFSGSMRMVSCTSYMLTKSLCLLNGRVLSCPFLTGVASSYASPQGRGCYTAKL